MIPVPSAPAAGSGLSSTTTGSSTAAGWRAPTWRRGIGPDGRAGVQFCVGDRPQAVIVYSVGEVAMALNLSGHPLPANLGPERIAELVVAAHDTVGADRIQELDAWARRWNLLASVRPLNRVQAREERQVWSAARQRRCADLAYRLAYPADAGQAARQSRVS